MALWTFLSSNLKGIRYDAETSVLFVHFVNGKVFAYVAVPHSVYLEFRDAPSAGKYYAANIKGKYPSQQVFTQEVPQ